MKLILIVILIALPFTVMAQHSIGLQVNYTKFKDTDFFDVSTKNFVDDTDVGYGIYYIYQSTDLLRVKTGYIDHGEFAFNVDGNNFHGESSSIYVAWAPNYEINSNLDLTFGLGYSKNELKFKSNKDDESGLFTTIGFNYQYQDKYIFGMEAGSISGVVGDIDPIWLALNVEYMF
ncbi:hypothetical protein E2K93_00465 [Thalassotalea sp. HSM 43]|uniref:outer membrane beta-barrel protein n=1 Tax=Thalassotalea sp. HSM 43 TaxID=2552945 RepID=UPI0010806D83|nr:outer membrane beta-barrel protein [Thalassotalea sp. HSM 43]QBY02935.1 hypothetical protein E2K93_00465 [Thalassotalea sp. HSM 43]